MRGHQVHVVGVFGPRLLCLRAAWLVGSWEGWGWGEGRVQRGQNPWSQLSAPGAPRGPLPAGTSQASQSFQHVCLLHSQSWGRLCLGHPRPDLLLLLPLSHRLGPEGQGRGLLPEGWGSRQCPGAQLCPSDLVTTHGLAPLQASQGSLCFPPPGGRHNVEAKFRPTYSLRNLGNGPGLAGVSQEAQTNAALS